MRQWEDLFKRAAKQLDAGKLSISSWSFGGGTALMLALNHRYSKDIDIFLPDRQLLAYVSPRVNDGAGAQDYDEHENFTKLYFPEGEIDFIASPAVTPIKPILREIAGVYAYVESPAEILAKKIVYRADNFKPRDIFDLAVAYAHLNADILKVAPLVAPKVEALSNRITQLDSSGQLESQLNDIDILDGGRKVRGHELDICRQCLNDIYIHKDQPLKIESS